MSNMKRQWRSSEDLSKGCRKETKETTPLLATVDKGISFPERVGLVERSKPKKKMGENRDSGWAWVVALAACLINLIIAGLGRMSGILYVAFIERFDVTRKDATQPFSIRSSTRNLLGPVVGILGQKYGVRAVTLAGGILGAASASACYFAPDMLWITIIWGGINGMATAMTTTLIQVVIGQYFEKHQATASGMAFSGGCIGSFIFPVLLEYLLHTYGIQGTFLLIGGISMNVIPAALILRRPYWLSDSNTSVVTTTDDDDVKIVVVSEIHIDDISPDVSLDRPADANSSCKDKKDEKKNDCPSHPLSVNNSCKTEKPPDIVSDIKPHLKKFPGGSYRGGSIAKHIKTACKLYGKAIFLLICACRSVHYLTFVPIVTVVVDYGMDKGLQEADGKFIIAALSAGDLIGRIGFGWVTDRKCISLPKFMLIMMMLQGATTACLPLLNDRVSVMMMIAVFGLVEGAIFIRHPILVTRYMEEDEQAIAMGCINFFSGLLGLALPYFIGYFRDNLGSYDYMFFIIGAIASAIGFLWLLEPYLVKCNTKELSEEST